jgi:hypothetical protein
MAVSSSSESEAGCKSHGLGPSVLLGHPRLVHRHWPAKGALVMDDSASTPRVPGRRVTPDVEQRHPVVHEPSLIPLGSGRGVALITVSALHLYVHQLVTPAALCPRLGRKVLRAGGDRGAYMTGQCRRAVCTSSAASAVPSAGDAADSHQEWCYRRRFRQPLRGRWDADDDRDSLSNLPDGRRSDRDLGPGREGRRCVRAAPH